MALKKSELYSSLWSSCDELRGSMDASQYKDYVLVLLFIKYVSDKYAGQPFAPITIPEGASFKDMVALKGKSDIGDQINKKIIAPLANANKLSDMPDFNEPTKLGSGREMVDRLTNLIATVVRIPNARGAFVCMSLLQKCPSTPWKDIEVNLNTRIFCPKGRGCIGGRGTNGRVTFGYFTGGFLFLGQLAG